MFRVCVGKFAVVGAGASLARSMSGPLGTGVADGVGEGVVSVDSGANVEPE